MSVREENALESHTTEQEYSVGMSHGGSGLPVGKGLAQLSGFDA